ncbi:P-loop containing nucleoside triphosphate hydrolase protein [Dissophora ornata]|nr:P-loop containing nucleoside triphosphate hydrolase protein [Dissophora ornata]
MNDTVGNWVRREDDNPDFTPWASEQQVYDWQPSYTTETAPGDPRLEAELFGEENRINSGINFKNYSTMKVVVKGGPPTKNPLRTFEDAGLHPTVLENVIRMKYSEPTPIQKNAIPILLSNYDLMACAQTGSGKTAAFLVPVLSMLLKKIASGRVSTTRIGTGNGRFKASPLLLVILPTRELAIQLFEETRRFSYKTPLRPAVIYGGADVRVQADQIRKGCDILLATPGRLKDFVERGNLSLANVRHVVLDEADRMLDMGFERQIREIMLHSNLPRDESLQTLMFSATFPKEIQILARDFLKEDFCRLQIGRIGGTTNDITQRVHYVDDHNKRDLLVRILLEFPPSRTMIFVETKRTADNLDDFLYNKMFPTCSIHGDRNQTQREQALRAFKNGKSPILIATAVASRGLDIKDVMHVVNYDMSNDIDDYVHRIGRTARAGNPGFATTFYNSRNECVASQLTKLLQECQQDIPEFLMGYRDPNSTYETEGFFDDDDPERRTTSSSTGSTSGGGGHGNWGQNPGTSGGGGYDNWGSNPNTSGQNPGAWGSDPNTWG